MGGGERAILSEWHLNECLTVRSLDIPFGIYPEPVKDEKQGRLEEMTMGVRRMLHDKRLAEELLRTAITATVFICIVMLMTLAQMFSDRWFDMYSRDLMRTTDSSGSVIFNSTALHGLSLPLNETVFATDPLFDHVFTLLPDKSAMRGWLPDMLLTSFLTISLIVTLVLSKATRIKYQGIVVARRMMWILSLLYMFRMCSFLVTTVPNPVHNCVPKYPQDPTAYLFFIGNMATGQISACTDNIYSGHTALVTVVFYTNLVYSGRWYFTVYSFFHGGAVLVTILLTRLHYTVDVLLALFMTSFVYCLYHFLLLIYIDQQIIPKGQDPRLLDDRRLLLRLVNDTMLHMIFWMDGMDLRICSPQSPINTPNPSCADSGAGVIAAPSLARIVQSA